MIARVKLFAVARQMAQRDTLEIELPADATVADLRAKLVERLPGLAGGAAHLMIAVDNEYADDRRRLDPNQEIACIPPVSGG